MVNLVNGAKYFRGPLDPFPVSNEKIVLQFEGYDFDSHPPKLGFVKVRVIHHLVAITFDNKIKIRMNTLGLRVVMGSRLRPCFENTWRARAH